MVKRTIVVGNEGYVRDDNGCLRIILGPYVLVQHTSDYNVIYLRDTGEEIAMRTTLNASRKILVLLNDAYELGKRSSRD